MCSETKAYTLNIKSGNIDTAFNANWVTIDEIIVVGYLTPVFVGVVSAGTWRANINSNCVGKNV